MEKSALLLASLIAVSGCASMTTQEKYERGLAMESVPRLRTHNQNMTVAARAMAERKTSGQRSYRVATRR
ncbi:hypothetical protein SAMN06265173_1751, partial [Thalassovita litoralis]